MTLTPELVSRTREGQPDKLRRRLAGDLDEIILTALRKEPDRRYASVEQFSEDIRRHLDGLPVTARRDTFRYRWAKFVRRNRTAVIAAAAFALSLIGGIAATTWQTLAAIQAQHLIRAEALKVERVNAFLTGMLASVDTNSGQGPQGAVRAILDEATENIEGGALGGQPVVEAAVRMTIGETYVHLGLYDDAEPHLTAALEIRRREHGQVHADVAESLNGLGLLAKARGDDQEVEDYYRSALEIRGELLGERSAEYAETLNNLGVLLKRTGRLEPARDLRSSGGKIRPPAIGGSGW